MAFIHPTAHVHPRVELGEKVYVGPYSVIERNVKIASNTKLISHVVVHENTIIGEKNTFHSFSAIGGTPQDLKFSGKKTYLIIGRNNTIREHVTIHRATGVTTDRTLLGDDNLLMAGAHIAHDCSIGNNNVIANNVGFAGHCIVGNHTVIGAYSIFQQYLMVGSGCFVSFGSIIRKNIAPFSKVAGTGVGLPAKTFGVNSVGMKRNGVSQDAIKGVQFAAKILLSNNPLVDRVSNPRVLELSKKHKEVYQMLEFVKSVKQGVISYQYLRAEETDRK